jgi:hydrogenase maturation protein HypF
MDSPVDESTDCDVSGPDCLARRLRLVGRVQGVGFRPFVYRLANELGLCGSVQNLRGEVEILVQGRRSEVERFSREVIDRAPALASPRLQAARDTERGPLREFVILESAVEDQARIFVPPDAFTCEACLAELARPADRRYRYPFINCTQCGPRYTLIEALPYDRANTTMSAFALCAHCAREYRDPLDRRFHAEPVACPACGPHLWLEEAPVSEPSLDAVRRGEPALERAVELLRSGQILAVKGIGGYHLLCDAANTAAVDRLRARKRRPDKPLAVMFPQAGGDGLDRIRQHVQLSDAEARSIVSPPRPIVLARKRREGALAPSIAPGLNEIGVFLPYSPLHHLLLGDFGGPVVATSGNVSGEPVLIEAEEVRTHLATIADASLHHDRAIARPADDSVVRCLIGEPRTLRLGRGLAPLELSLPRRIEHPLLATGGHLKTTIALAWEERVVISPHIGDMGSGRSEKIFAQVAEDLQRLYAVRAAEAVCDAHPDYATTRWAEDTGLPVTRVLHHLAHASAIAGEHATEEPLLVFAWDGAGFGEDGTLWGGETFVGVPGRWRRVASLRPFRLPGGELAARAPWRSAAAVCWALGTDPPGWTIESAVRSAWRRGLNCPQTSSVGRLFDAAAALLLGLRESSYEGHAPMMLEAAACGDSPAHACADLSPRSRPMPLYEDPTGLTRLDWGPLIGSLLDAGHSPAARALSFHATLAATILAVARHERGATGVERVGLAGGVFQNALLTELAHESLARDGFHVCLAEQVPCNDGGLSYGQIIERAYRQAD